MKLTSTLLILLMLSISIYSKTAKEKRMDAYSKVRKGLKQLPVIVRKSANGNDLIIFIYGDISIDQKKNIELLKREYVLEVQSIQTDSVYLSNETKEDRLVRLIDEHESNIETIKHADEDIIDKIKLVNQRTDSVVIIHIQQQQEMIDKLYKHTQSIDSLKAVIIMYRYEAKNTEDNEQQSEDAFFESMID